MILLFTFALEGISSKLPTHFSLHDVAVEEENNF